MFGCLGLVVGAMPAGAQDAPLQLHYAAYSHGFNVIILDTILSLHPGDYRLQVDYRTSGVVGMVMNADGSTIVDGRFVDGRAVPREMFSKGHIHGELRVSQIDWHDGSPRVVQLVPTSEPGRDGVPERDQANTIDTLSAMAGLLHRVATTHRCDGSARTFDGRRLSEIDVHTVGDETLEPTSRSIFQGPALRCDFTGRQIGGFMHDQDEATLRKPQQGSAWFARLQPGAPMVPVRMVFTTARFGDMTMYISAP